MRGGFFCVAGWNLHVGEMSRPLQPNGDNWRLQPGTPIVPCNVVNFDIVSGGHGAFPHRTEDTLVAREPHLLEALSEPEAYKILRDTAFPSIATLFENQLVQDRYVVDGTHVRSLGGVLVPVQNLQFFETFEKLRVHVRDSDGMAYGLKVTSDELQTIFAQDGVTGANEWLQRASRDSPLILRVGLARAWDGPDRNWDPKRCYVQLNGVIRSTD